MVQSKNVKNDYLLVTLDSANDTLVQTVFELALQFQLAPISFNGSTTAFVFEDRSNVSKNFRDELISKKLPVKTEIIQYSF